MIDLQNRIAERQVERFVRRFGETHRPLAYHAAIPLVLTPDLVNYLRKRFLLNQVPHAAEADLLLSDLCREIGRGLYAIDLAVRNYLLHELREKFGEERVREIARLLLTYIDDVAQRGDLPDDELQAERWVAMAYIDQTRDQMVNELVAALWDCVSIDNDGTTRAVNWPELVRLLAIIEEITPEITSYPELIKYTELLGQVIDDHSGERTLELLKSDIFAQEFLINGRSLPKAHALLNKKRYSSISAADIIHNESRKLLQESLKKQTPVSGRVVGQKTKNPSLSPVWKALPPAYAVVQLVNDPDFRHELNQASKSAFNRYSNLPYDSWQELAHEVFITVCSSVSFAEYRRVTNVKGYLYRIAINHLIDKRRSSKSPRRKNLVDLDEVNLPHSTEKRLRDEILTGELLAQLNKDEQFIIVSWMHDDKTLTEIANDLGISKTTMSKRFAKIIHKLQRRLKVKKQ